MTPALATDTHCPYCSLQCAMTLATVPDESVPARTPSTAATAPRLVAHGRDFPTNGGGMCRKGWTSPTLLNTPGRLTSPLVRGEDGELHEASWERALSLVAERVLQAQAAGGRDAVALFGGGGLTNEKAYTLGKFARVAVGTRYIDYNGRFCMSSAAAAGSKAFGLDRGLPFPLTDLRGAQAVLLLGSNPAETMPPALRHLEGVRRAGGLIVVDPRRTATAALTADGGGLHLQPLPGTDVIVLLGLLHLVIAAGGVDEEYVAARVSGWDAVRRSVSLWWPERVESGSGVPIAQLRAAADLLIAASPSGGGHGGGSGGGGAYIVTGRGAEQHAHGTDTVTAAINLALALGLPGREGSGYGCFTGQGNGQGGREHGQKADQLPGYRSILDPAARAHVAAVWGVEPDDLPGPGVPAVDLLGRLGTQGGPSILFVHGANLLVSAPNATVVAERLSALDLLVVCDFVLSETAARADVVLPTTQWAEEAGTMTSLEGRVLRRRRALTPPPGVRTELEIWADLAERLGCPVPFATEPDCVLEELGRASAGGVADYRGITAERLDRDEALYWPCPSTDHPGTPRLFLERFATADGRAVMRAVGATPVVDDLRSTARLYLTTGRVLEHYQSGAQTRRVPELVAGSSTAYAQIHPLTAQSLGIEEGLQVRITSARGECVVPARLSVDIRPDVIFVPFHFPGEQRVNSLTSDAVDPISGMPEFKACAVDVRLQEA